LQGGEYTLSGAGDGDDASRVTQFVDVGPGRNREGGGQYQQHGAEQNA